MVSKTDLAALLERQDWGKAEKLLRKAAKDRRAPADVFYNLALVLEAAGKPEQRKAWLTKAVARRPDYARAWFELGRAHLEAADVLSAKDAFQKACQLDPEDRDARLNMGRIALRLCDWDLAETCYAQSDDSEARVALYRIAAERGTPAGAARDHLLEHKTMRAEALRAMTRVAKGALPLRF